MLPLRARVDPGVMKGISAFPKTPALLDPHGEGSYPTAEMLSEYSTATVDRAVNDNKQGLVWFGFFV